MKSSWRKLRKRLTLKEKEKKKKMIEHDNLEDMSDQSNSNGAISSDGGPQELRINSARRALKSPNERLRQSSR